MEQEPQAKPRKFYLNKLVRDKIPQLHHEDGWEVELEQVAGAALKERLLEKLAEESEELQQKLVLSEGSRSDRSQCLKEVADIKTVQERLGFLDIEYDYPEAHELIEIAIEQFDLKDYEIKQAIRDKTEKNGAFNSGLVLLSVEATSKVVEDDWLLHYYRQLAQTSSEILLPPNQRK